MAELKYGKYINRKPAMALDRRPERPVEPDSPERPGGRGGAFPFLYINANSWPEIPVNCNFAILHITYPYLMPDPPHSHPFDEFLFFMGDNLADIDDFGAVIEVGLGEEWEKHVIDTTSVVYLPAGLSHCPINVKKVDKPILFGHVMLSATYSKQ